MKSVLAVIALFASAVAVAASGFEGRWVIKSISVIEAESEWASPSKLPAIIELRQNSGGWVALYTDQSGVTINCSFFREVIEGNEALLFGCPAPYKSNVVFSPLHRVQLSAGTLNAIVITDKVVYTWSAVREGK